MTGESGRRDACIALSLIQFRSWEPAQPIAQKWSGVSARPRARVLWRYFRQRGGNGLVEDKN